MGLKQQLKVENFCLLSFLNVKHARLKSLIHSEELEQYLSIIGLFTDMAATFNCIVPNFHYGMLRGQISMYSPLTIP